METINNNYFKGSKKIIKRVLYPILLLLLLLLLSVNSIYTIREQEQAVLTTFGIATPVTDSGQQVHKVNTTIQGFSIGYDNGNNSNEAESLMITSDYNFVNVDFFVEYKISDPVKALYASEKPVVILKKIGRAHV